MSAVKNGARQLIDELPENATWEDVAYAVLVREKIERGMADEAAGDVRDHEDVERDFLERYRVS